MEYQEFIYHNESERQFLEDEAIYSLVLKMFQRIKEDDIQFNHKIKGDLFDKEIAFKIEKKLRPPFQDDYGNEIKGNSEMIILKPIAIKKQQLSIETTYKHKYSFKERIRILFKGE